MCDRCTSSSSTTLYCITDRFERRQWIRLCLACGSSLAASLAWLGTTQIRYK